MRVRLSEGSRGGLERSVLERSLPHLGLKCGKLWQELELSLKDLLNIYKTQTHLDGFEARRNGGEWTCSDGAADLLRRLLAVPVSNRLTTLDNVKAHRLFDSAPHQTSSASATHFHNLLCHA